MTSDRPARSLPLAAMMALAAMPIGLAAGPLAFEVNARRKPTEADFRDILGLPPDDLEGNLARSQAEWRNFFESMRKLPEYVPEPKLRKKFRHNRRG